PSCFWAKNGQLSSNWASRVWGGKGHESLVGVVSVSSGQAAVAHHRIAVGPHQPAGLADAAPLGEVLRDRDGFLLGEVRPIPGRALAFREPRAAGATPQDPVLLSGATAAVDAEVVTAAPAMPGPIPLQAAEPPALVP